MMRRSGATIMELVVTTSVCATVLGVAGMAYVLVAKRSNRDAARAAVALQASALAEDLTKTIRRANTAKIENSGSGKKLKLEIFKGIDTDGDHIPDQIAPKKVKDDGTFDNDAGPTVSYYWADYQGKGNSGGYYWRFLNGSGGYDGPDESWSLVNGNSRWSLLESIEYGVDLTNQTVTFTIVCSSLARADRTATGVEANADYTRVTLTRTVGMRSGN